MLGGYFDWKEKKYNNVLTADCCCTGDDGVSDELLAVVLSSIGANL